jgi:hypothetical protein
MPLRLESMRAFHGDILHGMEIVEATAAINQILNEERERPTISYEDVANEWVKRSNEMTPEEIATWSKITSVPRKNLWTRRKEHPRPVTETPQIYQFSGTNFDLLMSVYGRLTPVERPQLIEYILRRVQSGGTRTYPKPENYVPSFDGKVCELPLIAEFCIRTGSIEPFFAATAKPPMPTPALAIMMIQVEDTIALNWNWFSNEQLQEIPKWLDPLREIAHRQTYASVRQRSSAIVRHNPHYKAGYEPEGNQIVKSINGITKECQQARYWYLKGMLQRTVNAEVESDKAKVEEFLTQLGFSADMIKTLNAAENDYKSANPFELKSCLGHIRSFLEHLHREAAKSIAATAGDTVDDRWGAATSYLRQQGYLTNQQEGFSTSLYTLISDTSVHPLGTEREYARLLRNVVIEYGVMFLAMLAKNGIKVS